MEAYAQLLGTPRIRLAGTTHVPPLTKANVLLFYLAYKGAWCSRDDLLFLFYADTPEAVARNNLRQRLTAVRRLPYNDGLEIDPTRLRWPISTDVQRFKKAVREGDDALAISLYQGKLLEGFGLPDAPEFEAWLELEREKLQRQWRTAGLSLAQAYEDTGRPLEACDVLERLYEAEPYDEEVLRHYLQALSLAGQRSKALAVFAAFQAQLQSGLGAEPEGVTLQHAEQIAQQEQAPRPPGLRPRALDHKQVAHHNLTSQATPFVGREAEKKTLSELLHDPSCRLLTLVGAGGIGKTRLAIEVAGEALLAFRGGVYFVSFVAVTSPELMVYAVGDTLGFSFLGQQEPKAQLLDYLKDKKMLLVLDNLEHLLSGTYLIRDLLEYAPHLKVLATSRERLKLHAEQVIDLYGLSVPEREEQDALAHDAVKLFMQSVGSVRADFALDDAKLPTIVHICRLVQGMPLAVELAASWLRALTLEDIAAEIEKGIDVLSASTRDLPERHNSIRAVFDYSWRLLSDEEQTVLRRLAVCQGGFRREAATEIARATLSVLAALVDKSFLTLTRTGRYRRHPLVIQYTQERLAEHPEEKTSAEEQHGLYYLHFMQERRKEVFTRASKDIYESIDEEYPNIKKAWQWVIDNERVEELKRYAFVLDLIFRHRSLEGEQFYARLVAALDASNPRRQIPLGYVLIMQSQSLEVLSRLEEARACAERALELLLPTGDTQGIMRAQFSLGLSLWGLGELAQARGLLRQGLVLSREHPEYHFTGYFLYILVLIEREFATFEQVKQFFEEAIAEVKRLGLLNTLAMLEHDCGAYLFQHGFVEEGARRAWEGFELLREVYDPRLECYALLNVAVIEFKLGDYDKAEALALEALDVAETLSMKDRKALAFTCLARVALARGQHLKAQQHLKEGLQAGRPLKQTVVLHALIFSAELAMAQSKAIEAAVRLGVVQRQSGYLKEHAVELERLLKRLREALPPEELNEALERAKAIDLAEAVTEVLRLPFA